MDRDLFVSEPTLKICKRRSNKDIEILNYGSKGHTIDWFVKWYGESRRTIQYQLARIYHHYGIPDGIDDKFTLTICSAIWQGHIRGPRLERRVPDLPSDILQVMKLVLRNVPYDTINEQLRLKVSAKTLISQGKQLTQTVNRTHLLAYAAANKLIDPLKFTSETAIEPSS